MPIMNRGETICQEETEQAPRAREPEREEERADAVLHPQRIRFLPLVAGNSAAPDAAACKAVDSVVDLRARNEQRRRKRSLNGSVKCCRQD